ncbi:MAG TPA: hypothetical protein VLG46_14810 [Anaerolineae bacterium]|nr:hypothetical protein [Anaerolineae bacterium]
MPNIRAEPYQPLNSQDITRQRLAAGRQEIRLLTHLLQASLVVERSNPLRRAITAHRNFVRNVTITIVLLLSVTIGLLAPQIARLLGIY